MTYNPNTMKTMPSDRRAIMVRLPKDEAARFDSLHKRLTAKLKPLEVSASDVIRHALLALERELNEEGGTAK